MTTPNQDTGRYDRLRAYFAGLPREQYSVDLPFSKIEEMIGGPLTAEATDDALWRVGKDGPRSPLGFALEQAGFGVLFSAGTPSSSGFVRLGRGLHRWPGVFVRSDEFSDLEFAERLRQLAYGYLESGKVLCASLGDSPDSLTWPRALVVCLCCRHATELFYKSCIVYRGRIEDCNHDIGNLKRQFQRLYPEPEFNVQTLYDRALHKHEDQLLRYFADRTGQVPEGSFGFTPADWMGALECLELTMNRTYAQIGQKAAEAEPLYGPIRMNKDSDSGRVAGDDVAS